MAVMTTRDALRQAICHVEHPDIENRNHHRCDLKADALLASGAVVDAATLADRWREEGRAVLFNRAGDDLSPEGRVLKWLRGALSERGQA